MGRKWRSKMKTMKKMMTFLAVAGFVLALGFGATPAQANAVWTGDGDGVNWSDMLNWQDGIGGWGPTGTDEDPRIMASGGFILLGGSNTTVDANTATWNTIDRVYVSGGTLTIVDGGTLAVNGRFQPSGGQIIQTGGLVDVNDRITSLSGGTVTISGGAWDVLRWTYTYGGTLHIIGTNSTLVKHSQYGDTGGGAFTQRFTLEAGGVTKHTGSAIITTATTTTIQVDGIENYTGPTGVGNEITLIEFSNEDPDWTNGHAVVDGVSDGNGGFLVDDGKGVVTITPTGAELTIIVLDPAIELDGDLEVDSVLENEATGTVVGVLSMRGVTDSWSVTNYSIIGGAGQSSFTIDGTSLKTLEIFDKEIQDSYEIDIQATDGSAPNTTNSLFTIAVSNVVEASGIYARATVAPHLTETKVATLEYLMGENTSVTYSVLAGYDGSDFEISGAGLDELHFDTAGLAILDAEYFVEVQAVGSPTTETSTQLVKVTVAVTGLPAGTIFLFQ